ncbi:MAG TPA: 1-(5-phosphoribosyl)-5-[(5-phosphoribosylamino)methylideneamino]imidazole-4-carboxamide isomerase [Alphaproteobacteria bacterium]|nr:1-(5-phosphoribosyl)-5-[(5-phosphoribosylamino)methylideneamino]imidazole-4-carboxamide isomerase [Micavibrio sp.]MBK9562391.1 1-(5-phosphoribosyl)-5-[(5-phosphoribosylamino)methylideneamino]imidazole-4-carboxamide isomerase [Micavibrio sp.]HQX26959.1 1-(5-phosphoribosyl)-5-[(5-phosphoribosylamino)methylideneamino]imidazole-4-carboxamide isomerase [Alphaproteobacteria bacterium]
MIIYPAIDLKGGKCVRLTQGDMSQDTVYNDDPAAQAHEWARAGFSWLHVVDLDGAIKGAPANSKAVRKIIKAVDLPVQLGGGIRTHAQIEHWLQEGVSRVILGTAAVRDPDLVRRACREFPDQIAVGIDAREGRVSVEGWVRDAKITAAELAKHFEDAGVAAIIYTDISRDGTGSGINIDETVALAAGTSIPVIASGGVGSLADIRAVKNAALPGVIVGKAFYNKSVDPKEALAAAC